MMTVAERKDFVLDLIRILPCRLCSSSGKIPAGFSRMSRNNLRSLWLVWIAVAASKIRPLHCWLCMSAHRNNSLAFACLVIWWHRDTRTVAPEEVDVNRALESNYGKCFCNIARRKCCSRFSSSLHASGKRRRICPSVEPPTMPVSQIVPKENIPPNSSEDESIAPYKRHLFVYFPGTLYGPLHMVLTPATSSYQVSLWSSHRERFNFNHFGHMNRLQHGPWPYSHR